MGLPNKDSNPIVTLPTIAGADSSAPVITQSSTGGTGGWPPWAPPWNQPTMAPNIVPNPINPFIPQQPIVQPLPYVPNTITTDGTGINPLPFGALDRLLYALGIVIFGAHVPEKCSSCEQEREIVLSYGRTISRKICKICATKVLDSIFSAKVDAELESILYDKTDTK